MEFMALIDGAQPNADFFGIFVLTSGVDRRSAVRAKVLQSFATVVSMLHVELWLATRNRERLPRSADGHPICGSGETLAVGAVTDGNHRRIDLSLVRYK